MTGLVGRAGVFATCLVVTLAAGCGSSSKSGSGTTTTTGSTPSATASAVCGNRGVVPQQYQSVVVFSFENRTWSDVGGVGFGTNMPYMQMLGKQCTAFTDWAETDTHQNSLTQYVGQITGARQAGTVNDCSPSASCSTTADSIFRQLRVANRRAINYVEGATKPCSASGNAAKHIPALYLRGDNDPAHCNEQVRPYTEFDPNALPAFAFITPTLCHDGHDCGNGTVDTWARTNIQPVLKSAAYKSGKVAVFIWYDEDHPVPNLWITPTAHAGAVTLSGAGYAGTLTAWESMLGLPCLASACTAPDMRAAANS